MSFHLSFVYFVESLSTGDIKKFEIFVTIVTFRCKIIFSSEQSWAKIGTAVPRDFGTALRPVPTSFSGTGGTFFSRRTMIYTYLDSSNQGEYLVPNFFYQ